MHIAIEGCIGAGKSTTAGIIAARLGVPFLAEASDRHPFLDAFYSDAARYAFETELGFLLIHYHQLFHRSNHPLITDFSFEKDLIFARMNLSGRDLALFEVVYQDLHSRLRPPDLTIVLNVPISTLMTRIQMRGRSYERSMPAVYLEQLRSAYTRSASFVWNAVQEIAVRPEQSPDDVADAVLLALGKLRSPANP